MPKMHSELNFRYADVLAAAAPEADWPGAAAAAWQNGAAAVSCPAAMSLTHHCR